MGEGPGRQTLLLDCIGTAVQNALQHRHDSKEPLPCVLCCGCALLACKSVNAVCNCLQQQEHVCIRPAALLWCICSRHSCMAHTFRAEASNLQQRSNELVLKQCHAHGHIYSWYLGLCSPRQVGRLHWVAMASVSTTLCKAPYAQKASKVRHSRNLQGHTQYRQTCHFICCQQPSPFSSAPSSLFTLP